MTKHTELQTIRDYVRFATSVFNENGLYYGHGTTNAWDEAIALIFYSLHLPHELASQVFDAKLTQEEQDNISALIVERIEKRIPLPYLTHEAWFAGLTFYVDERVLIPRSPIAELIENHFNPWIEEEQVKTVLDLCTGSGCIAIACAKAFPDAQIDASDISKEALTVAKINSLRHDVEDQVQLYESDLFSALPVKQYDIIVSNPPYVSYEEMETLPEEYLHEPQKALQADDEGLDFVVRILREAPQYLSPHGILVVEVGNSEYALIERFPNVPFTWVDFERGGGGVFLLTADELANYRGSFLA